MYGWFVASTSGFIDFHMRSELATIVQRSSGNISTGSSDASWHQYSNSSPASAMSGHERAVVVAEPGEQRQLLADGPAR